MKHALIGMAGALVLSMSATAYGADLAARPYTKAPPMPAAAVYNWTGFYIGGTLDTVGVIPQTTSIALQGYSSTAQQVTQTACLGAGWQVSPNWLIGIEADGSVSDIHGTSFNCTATGCGTGSGTIEDFGTVRARLGYVVNNFLLYGTGGWAWSHSNTDRTITCVVAGGGICPGGPSPSPLTGAVASSSGFNSGWAAGAGIEWMFAPNRTAKVEYQHLQFDNVTRDFNYPGFPTAFRQVVSDVRIDTVRVGVNYIFGGPAISRY